MSELAQDRSVQIERQNGLLWGVIGIIGLCACLIVPLSIAGAVVFFFTETSLSAQIPAVIESVAIGPTPTQVSGLSVQQDPTVAPTPTLEQTGSAPASVEVGIVVDMEIMRSPHVEAKESHDDYNTDPPTSGPHYANSAPTGVYEESVADEFLVHNMEHGDVIIWYQCDEPTACEELVEELRDLYNSIDNQKVVIAPRQGLKHAIALTAWGKLAYLDQVDREFIEQFVTEQRSFEPEQEKMCGLQET